MSVRRVITEPPWSERKSTAQEVVVRGRTKSELWGFGQHPATSLCLSVLAGLYAEGAPRPRRMVELNCGSGLLCIAAAKLGAESATGIESDAELRAIAEENSQLNHAITKFVATRAESSPPYDLAVANLTVVELHQAEEALAALAADGHLMVAGFLEEERESLEQAFIKRGFRFLYRETREGFLASVFKARARV